MSSSADAAEHAAPTSSKLSIKSQTSAGMIEKLKDCLLTDPASPEKDLTFRAVLSDPPSDAVRSRQHNFVVISFLRRFGCPVCRYLDVSIDSIIPSSALSTGLSHLRNDVLRDYDIRMIAIAAVRIEL